MKKKILNLIYSSLNFIADLLSTALDYSKTRILYKLVFSYKCYLRATYISYIWSFSNFTAIKYALIYIH